MDQDIIGQGRGSFPVRVQSTYRRAQMSRNRSNIWTTTRTLPGAFREVCDSIHNGICRKGFYFYPQEPELFLRRLAAARPVLTSS